MKFIDDKEKDESEYIVEEEKMKTVFKKPKTILIEDDDENSQSNESPQNNEEYQVKSQILEEEVDGLSPINISKEMRKSFLEYAMSVIVSRALPDARDGLKPVHRRIIFSMQEQGITSSTAHKKSARIVGDVLGKYHPHGDASIYDAMVRMAQNFSMRYPLVDGHGNFGSIDGDKAAAMRYTEARMSKIADMMVDSIKKNTVNFVPNYDGSENEPSVLPSRIPNLLVAGSTGIAVGMATNIPPHNLKEIINGVIQLAQNPEITIEELSKFIKGPDFPTGGIIMGIDGIQNTYSTGKGSIILRSKTHIEELKNGKSRIIVTEIPYMVNKSKMIAKIAELVKDKKIDGITDLRDETSRKGIRVVIELRRNVFPEIIQNQLFKLTQLQTNFSANILALVDGSPKILNLKQALEVYLKHQIEVVTRKTQFDLDKSITRKNILEGLKIAIQNIDEVIKIIKKSNNDKNAQDNLKVQFNLSIEQAKAIIDMRLGRLTGLAIENMIEELKELDKFIKSLKNILENKNVLIEKIISELTEIKNKFSDDRCSEIIEDFGYIQDEDLIPQKDIAITLSSSGYVKRIPLEEYYLQNRGGIGSKSMNTYEDDDIQKIITATTHTDLLIFTSYRKVYRIRAHEIPELSKQSKGIPFINIIGINKDEKVISLLITNSYKHDEFLLTITKRGIVKKTQLAEYSSINKNGKIALGLKTKDELVQAMIVKCEDEIIIGSSKGKLVKFNTSEIRPMGRTAVGVKGMNLGDDLKTKVVGASISIENGFVLSIGENGFGKKTPVSDYRRTKRGAKGVKSINTSKAGYLKFVEVVEGGENILIITKAGITIKTTLSQVATSSRVTKGVKIIKLNSGNAIKSVAIINETKIEEAVEKAIQKTQVLNIEKLKQTEIDLNDKKNN